MAHEIQKKQCRICNELKPRIQFGTFSDTTNKRWVDDTGKQWNGHICPSCQRKRAAVHAFQKRHKPRVQTE